MSAFKDITDRRINGLYECLGRMASKSEIEDLRAKLEFHVSRHDELREQFDMLMNHLGLRIENGPRIVKDK